MVRQLWKEQGREWLNRLYLKGLTFALPSVRRRRGFIAHFYSFKHAIIVLQAKTSTTAENQAQQWMDGLRCTSASKA